MRNVFKIQQSNYCLISLENETISSQHNVALRVTFDSQSISVLFLSLLMVEVMVAKADLLGGGLSLEARYMKGSYREGLSKALTSASLTYKAIIN